MQRLIVVVDFSVTCHTLYYVLNRVGLLEHPGVIKASAAWLASCAWLGSLASRKNAIPVFVCDSKPYWRLGYLQQQYRIEYKKNRKAKSPEYYNLAAELELILRDRGYTFLWQEGYEADDWAAAISMLNPHRTLLATVDTDWLGLVSDRCAWFCLSRHAVRYRSTIEDINHWSASRLKQTFTQPADLWDFKARYGDAADSLPPRSPIEVIDLLNPPTEHRLWDNPQAKLDIASALAQELPRTVDTQSVMQYLNAFSVPRFIPTLD